MDALKGRVGNRIPAKTRLERIEAAERALRQRNWEINRKNIIEQLQGEHHPDLPVSKIENLYNPAVTSIGPGLLDRFGQWEEKDIMRSKKR